MTGSPVIHFVGLAAVAGAPWLFFFIGKSAPDETGKGFVAGIFFSAALAVAWLLSLPFSVRIAWAFEKIWQRVAIIALGNNFTLAVIVMIVSAWFKIR